MNTRLRYFCVLTAGFITAIITVVVAMNRDEAPSIHRLHPDNAGPPALTTSSSQGQPVPGPTPQTASTRPNPPPYHHASTRQATIEVKVRGSDGTLSSGARVHLLDGSDDQGVMVKTNSTGIAVITSLEPGNYQVWAESSTSNSGLQTVEARNNEQDRVPIELSLTRGTKISGRASTSDGFGVQASIRLIPNGHNHPIFHTRSNSRGHFVFPSIPKGLWETEVHAPAYSQQSAMPIEVTTVPSHLSVPMIAKADIKGIAVDQQGKPIVGATIRVSPIAPGQTKVTPPSTVWDSKLRWVHPLTGTRQLPTRQSRRFGAHRKGIRAPECGGGHCGVDLGSPRGSPVLAVANGTVVVASEDDRGKSGRYVAISHAGGIKTYYMHLDSIVPTLRPGATITAGTIIGTLGRSGIRHSKAHLHFALSKQDRGRAYFFDPEPILRFAVVYSAPTSTSIHGDHGSAVLHSQNNDDIEPPVSDSSGRFTIQNLSLGTYFVSAVHPDFAPGQIPKFVVPPSGRRRDLRIVLRKGRILRGKVLGPDGAATGSWVRAYQGVGESRRQVALTNVGPDASFTIRPLLGVVELEVGAPGYGVIRKTLATEGAKFHNLRFELSRFESKLRGQILTPDQVPLAAAEVRIVSGPAGHGRTTQTDTNGMFQFNKLPDGSYRIQIRSKAYPEFETTIHSNQVSKLAMLQGGSMRFTVRDDHSGASLAGVHVVAIGPQKRTITKLSDRQGHVVMRALLPGTWKVSVDSPEHIYFQRSLQIVPSPPGTPVEQVLPLHRGARLAGHVYDPKGNRAAGATLRLGSLKTKTDSEGHFDMQRVPTGLVTLQAQLHTAWVEQSLELFAGDELTTLELTLAENHVSD